MYTILPTRNFTRPRTNASVVRGKLIATARTSATVTMSGRSSWASSSSTGCVSGAVTPFAASIAACFLSSFFSCLRRRFSRIACSRAIFAKVVCRLLAANSTPSSWDVRRRPQTHTVPREAPYTATKAGKSSSNAAPWGRSRVVADLAAVRPRVRAGDREAEPAAWARCGAACATREAVEEQRHELRGHTRAVILHRHAQRAVLVRSADEHRRLAVAARVAGSGSRRSGRGRRRPARLRARDPRRARSRPDSSGETEWTISSSRSRTRTRCGRITTASASRRERSSSCSTSSRRRRICIDEGGLQLLELLRRELVAALRRSSPRARRSLRPVSGARAPRARRTGS